MTEWSMRVTIICPAAMRDDANDLAMVLGSGPSDGATFGAAMWTDTSGNLYAVASTLARGAFPVAAASPLARPAWDAEPYQVNMTGAERAQAALVIYDPAAPMRAGPDRLLAIIGDDPQAAVADAGVSYVEN
jgi:hypothetical protein